MNEKTLEYITIVRKSRDLAKIIVEAMQRMEVLRDEANAYAHDVIKPANLMVEAKSEFVSMVREEYGGKDPVVEVKRIGTMMI